MIARARARSALIGVALIGLIVGAALGTAVLRVSAEEPIARAITAEEAWIPWAPPSLKVHAAYMTLVNGGAADVSIVGVASTDYERVELHRSALKDGVSSMETVGEVTVPANGRVAFAPGGLHFMLIGPKRVRAIGEGVDITLRLRGGVEVVVRPVVRQRGTPMHGDHGHHGGGG